MEEEAMSIFEERGRSFEEEYFHKHEGKLIEKLRERARLEEIAEALAVKLQVDNPELLGRVMALVVTLDTAAAFLLAPLVQIAWGGGTVTNHEREVVLHAAAARGVEKGSPAYVQLETWLRQRPGDKVFDAAIEAIKTGLSVLTPAEQAERTKRIVEACRQVAGVSGGLGKVLGLGSGVSGEEGALLDAISTKLRAH